MTVAKRVLETRPPDDPDELYQLLVEAHWDLTAEQSRLVNSKLILLLANEIGDPAVMPPRSPPRARARPSRPARRRRRPQANPETPPSLPGTRGTPMLGR